MGVSTTSVRTSEAIAEGTLGVIFCACNLVGDIVVSGIVPLPALEIPLARSLASCADSGITTP